MTGLHEIVIEAVPGEGTALVQDGVTPERWISRHGTWVAEPVNSQIFVEVPDKILEKSRKIMRKIKNPIDLEWVWDGQDVYWVQMREITTIKELSVYSNRFSKDMMPGMIHPLIWSINVPLVNTVWLGVLEEIVGSLPFTAEELAKSFFYRSYFNMSTFGQVFTQVGFPSEGLEMMMGLVPIEEGKPIFKPSIKMLPLLPRIFRFIIDKWTFEGNIQSELPIFDDELARYTVNPEPGTSLTDQITEINDLYELVQKIVYFNVLTPIISTMYARMLEKQLKASGVSLLEFDWMANIEGYDQYQPNIALKKLHDEFIGLNEEISINHSPHDEMTVEDIKGTQFENDLKIFINDFGHLSDNSNNFMAVPWRETPELVLKMIFEFEIAQGQKAARVRFQDLSVKGLRKYFLRIFYNRARKFALYREEVSKQYIYGYSLFRPYFFRLAEEMIRLGWLQKREDIFYLEWSEIQQAVADGDASNWADWIDSRKQEMEEYQDVVLPDIIYGDNLPPAYSEEKGRLTGTPTSQGYYAGIVKVIHGRQDFDKVESGDIIVIPYSDVGWTPLFSRAGAVIAESGGLLSHSSIIAREYQIPAVVSVTGCMKLKDLQKVRVNGFSGEIILLEER
jgi:pyruvate,water dikinase